MNVILDPMALLLVGGGSILVAAVRSTGGDCLRAFAALRPLLGARVEADRHAARVAVNRIAERTQASGLATADRARLSERFVARAAAQLADTVDPAAFAAWGEAQLAARAERHAAAQTFWRAAADAAPAMGMIGTVLGLIVMFSRMDDPAAIGPGMALALTTTLYGLAMANLLFGPVAARLERLTRAELTWQRDTMERLEAIARGELEASPDPRARAALRRLRLA